MNLPNETYNVTDNSDGSFTLAIDSVPNYIQKDQVNTIVPVDPTVMITMSNGKNYHIWNWENEQNLGSTSAQDLADKINTIRNTP